jgi:hypothetical protein
MVPAVGAARDRSAHQSGWRIPRGSRACGRRLADTGAGCDDHEQRGHFLGCWLAAEDTQDGSRGRFLCRIGHSGMFPCFFGGNVCRLPRSMRNARMTYDRVCDGGITESTYPRSAAM